MAHHISPNRPDRQSMAPYNFVPLPEAVFLAPPVKLPDGTETKPWERHDIYLPGTYTGWVDLTITAETPLYVRCGPKVEDIQKEAPGDDHAALTRTHRHRQDFFHHGNPSQPVIPGSSLRGMVRSLVEILAAGKIQHTKSRRLYFRSLGRDAMAVLYRRRFATNAQAGRRGGLFKRTSTGGEIHPCDIARVLTNDLAKKLKQGDPREGREANSLPNWALQHQRVFVKVTQGQRDKLVTDIRLATDPNEPPKAQEQVGTIVITGWSNSKRREFVFLETRLPPVPVAADVIQDVEEDDQISRWQRDAFPKNKPEAGCRARAGMLRDGEPVFYLQDRNLEVFALGRAGMFRLPYDYRTEDMIPAALRRPEDLDLAMAIFGTVDEKNRTGTFAGRMIKGRVFFHDAHWNEKGNSPFFKDNQGIRSPKILSAPKPTAFQHYLTQTAPDNIRELFHYDSSPQRTQIRGSKRYWHKQQVDPFELVQNQKETQLTLIRPVVPGTAFTGRIRFENLTELELGALLSALQLPSSKRHHLGMGKPLGMGSVKIDVKVTLTERTQEGPENRYSSLFDDDGMLHLGLLSEEESERIGERAKNTFRQQMVEHYNTVLDTRKGEAENKNFPPSLPAEATLWEIPRLSVLSLLLEWDHRPDNDQVAYMPLGSAWRERYVLPTPHGVAEKPEPVWGDPPQMMSNQEARPQASPPSPVSRVSSGRPVSLPRSGDQVRCELLAEKTKRGGWRAKWLDGGINGAILPGGQEPEDAAPGKIVELIVHSFNPKDMSFRWPGDGTAKDTTKEKKKKK